MTVELQYSFSDHVTFLPTLLGREIECCQCTVSRVTELVLISHSNSCTNLSALHTSVDACPTTIGRIFMAAHIIVCFSCKDRSWMKVWQYE